MVLESSVVVVNNATKLPPEVIKIYRKQLIHTEVYVCATALLLAFLVVFGSFRRRSHKQLFKFPIWIAYVLSSSLISYAFGQMQVASFRNESFAFWAVFLLIAHGSCDSISAYSLPDNESKKRYNWEFLVLALWVSWLIAQYNPDRKFAFALYLLSIVTWAKTGERAYVLMSASRSYGLARNTKLIADFMSYEHTFSQQDEPDPVCMKGYNYLLTIGDDEEDVKVMLPEYQKRVEITEKIITLQKIWQCEGRLLNSKGDPDGQRKDICLSFALFRLLCCRFAGYEPFPGQTQWKSWNLVRHGLLSEEDGHERAFRVVEAELAFLYELFYTKYPVVVEPGFLIFRFFEFIFVIYGCWAAASVLNHHYHLHAPMSGYLTLATVGGHSIDIVVTGVVIAAIIFMEAVQLFYIIFSDWMKVKLLCKYVEKPSWQRENSMEKMTEIVCRKKWKPWERKLGQYSLLKSFNHTPSRLVYNWYVTRVMDKPRNGQKQSSHIKLCKEVKKAVINSLKTNNRELTNGIASLRRNGVDNELSWACRLETHTHVIMVWHIATSLCEVAAASSQANQAGVEENFLVASSLSKYCAYLVGFCPRLLPDHPYVTEFIFDQTISEARDVLKGCKSLKSKYEKMMKLGKDNNGERIIARGAKLGEDMIGIGDYERIWKILADFWADLLLFLAPSNDVTAHAETLANGGEFITHLWALLSHAGMLKRDSASENA